MRRIGRHSLRQSRLCTTQGYTVLLAADFIDSPQCASAPTRRDLTVRRIPDHSPCHIVTPLSHETSRPSHCPRGWDCPLPRCLARAQAKSRARRRPRRPRSNHRGPRRHRHPNTSPIFRPSCRLICLLRKGRRCWCSTSINETHAAPANRDACRRDRSTHEINVMQRILMVALAVMAPGIAGCAQGKYPISGETCGPQDPVKALDANDCSLPPGT